jgi:hypothetical protein
MVIVSTLAAVSLGLTPTAGAQAGGSGQGKAAGAPGKIGYIKRPPLGKPVQVKLGKARVRGKLDAAVIRRFVRRYLGKIRNCYIRRIATKPKLEGTVTLRFTIAATGQVGWAGAKGMDVVVARCSDRVVKGIVFPKPKSGRVKVVYPVTFTPAVGPPQVRVGMPSVTGDLDKSIIRRYIQRARNRLELCYRRQLIKRKKLAGKMLVRFTIMPTGKVLKPRASGMTRKLGRCVVGVFARLRFPKPKGGGLVQVRYPLVFRPSSTVTTGRPTGWGTIGTGRYGVIGHGSGTGSGYGTGAGRGGMRGRRSVQPMVRMGNPNAVGGLDKNIIRRYIRRKIPRIKFCYEKQLLVNAKLRGTVWADFVIAADGRVATSKATGVSKAVSSCVAMVVGTIRFPRPKGGGVVKVRYPFRFTSSGGSSGAPPKVALGAPRVRGQLGAKVVRRYLRRRLGALRACYRHSTQKKGKRHLTLRFVIGASGRVVWAKARGFDKAVASCADRVVKGIAFPRPKSGRVRVFYPLSVRAVGAKKTGTYGTIGHGRIGSGYGPVSRRPRRAHPSVRLGQPAATGGLDKNIIRRYIRRRRSRIKYCYEKQLMVKGSLEGTVWASFVIDAKGRVNTSTATGVSPKVASCVALVIRSIMFPKPRSGGVVKVRYPFKFRRSDAPRASRARVSARLGQPRVRGKLAAAVVRRHVRKNLGALRDCHRKRPAEKIPLTERLTLRFVIGSSGRVTWAGAKGVHEAVARCADAVVHKIVFPRPKSGRVKVILPLVYGLPKAKTSR